MSNQDPNPRDGAESGEALPPFESMAVAFQQAAEAYFGEPGHTPLEFPNPRDYERRADIPSKKLPVDREGGLREAAEALGIGSQSDLGAEAAGLRSGYTLIVEGGQTHKIIAQMRVLFEDMQKDGGVRPRAIIMAASPDRVIEGSERDAMIKLLWPPEAGVRPSESQIPRNEYELMRLIAERINGFSSYDPELGLDGEFDMGYNYTMEGEPAPGGDAAKPEERGRFMCIGVAGREIPVVMLRIDREHYEVNGERKFRQLHDDDKMRLVARLLQEGGARVQQVGLLTGALYRLTRLLAAGQVERDTGAPVRVVNYGAATMAEVKGDLSTPLSIGQLAGEMRLAYERVQEEAPVVVADKPDAE